MVSVCSQMHFIHMLWVSKYETHRVYVLSHYFFTTLGHGLIVQHLRYSEECGGYEELEPIDKNLQYDFNFQQSTHLRREVVILPVSQDFCSAGRGIQ